MAVQTTTKNEHDDQQATPLVNADGKGFANAAANGDDEKSKEKALTPDMDAAINAEVARDEKLAMQQLRGQKKVRIVIASGRDPAERSPVEVGVNGQHYLIERDKEVLVPEAVVNALKLALESVPTTDAQGRVAGFVPTMRYPMNVIGAE